MVATRAPRADVKLSSTRCGHASDSVPTCFLSPRSCRRTWRGGGGVGGWAWVGAWGRVARGGVCGGARRASTGTPTAASPGRQSLQPLPPTPARPPPAPTHRVVHAKVGSRPVRQVADHQAVGLAPVLVEHQDVGKVVRPRRRDQLGHDLAAAVDARRVGQHEADLFGKLDQAGGGVPGRRDQQLQGRVRVGRGWRVRVRRGRRGGRDGGGGEGRSGVEGRGWRGEGVGAGGGAAGACPPRTSTPTNPPPPRLGLPLRRPGVLVVRVGAGHGGAVVLEFNRVFQCVRVAPQLGRDGLALCRDWGWNWEAGCVGGATGAAGGRWWAAGRRPATQPRATPSPPLLRPTGQGLPNRPLALVLRPLLALQGLAVQVLPAKARVAAQHGRRCGAGRG